MYSQAIRQSLKSARELAKLQCTRHLFRKDYNYDWVKHTVCLDESMLCVLMCVNLGMLFVDGNVSFLTYVFKYLWICFESSFAVKLAILPNLVQIAIDMWSEIK